MPHKDNQIWHINLGIKLMIYFFYIITDDPVTHKVEVVETDIQQGAVMVSTHFTYRLQKCIANIRNIKTDGCTSLD